MSGRYAVPEQKEEASKGDERKQQVAEEGHIVARLLALRH